MLSLQVWSLDRSARSDCAGPLLRLQSLDEAYAGLSDLPPVRPEVRRAFGVFMARQVDDCQIPSRCWSEQSDVESVGVAILAGSSHDLHTQPLQLFLRRGLLSLQQESEGFGARSGAVSERRSHAAVRLDGGV